MQELEGDLRIEDLARGHRYLLDSFKNQQEPLVKYLQLYALRHQERDRLSRTRVALIASQGRDHLVGYYSLASSCIERDALGSIESLSGLPRFSVPAILLARLAVHESVQKRGVGVRLFADALKQVERAAALVGIRLLLTDAKDDEAMAYYESVGLLGVQSSGFPRRMVLDLEAVDQARTG